MTISFNETTKLYTIQIGQEETGDLCAALLASVCGKDGAFMFTVQSMKGSAAIAAMSSKMREALKGDPRLIAFEIASNIYRMESEVAERNRGLQS